VKLVVTIDTEEDHWTGPRPPVYTCENIERIPALQEVFDQFGVEPTYLTSYAVAVDERAASTLKAISDARKCEIGAHCHPWNTPPIAEADTEAAFGLDPLSFRSGRFGYDTTVARNLRRLGFEVDTSITPYVQWMSFHGPDFRTMSPRPFRFSADDAMRECSSGDLVEVPVTIGFLQRDFEMSNRIRQALARWPISKLRLVGILYRLRLVNLAWLSPEVSDSRTMIALARRMMRNGHTILNMTFHSPSLQAGLTPFTRSRDDERRFIQRVRNFLVFARGAGIEPMKLSDVRQLLPRQTLPQVQLSS